MSKIYKHPRSSWRTPEVWEERAWSLGEPEEKEDTRCLLLSLEKARNTITTIHARKGCHQAVLNLCWIKPSAGANHAAGTLSWLTMHFCVVQLRAIYLQPLTEGLLWGHLKAGRAPSLKPVYFVSWLMSGSRTGCCRIGSAWEGHWGWGSAAAPAPSAVKPPDHQTMAVCTVALYCGEL